MKVVTENWEHKVYFDPEDWYKCTIGGEKTCFAGECKSYLKEKGAKFVKKEKECYWVLPFNMLVYETIFNIYERFNFPIYKTVLMEKEPITIGRKRR